VQTLDAAPALRTLPAGKSGDFTPLFLFNKFACGNFRLLYSYLIEGISPLVALFSSSSRSLTKVTLQHSFWGDVSPLHPTP
jgi:hypothetical protein